MSFLSQIPKEYLTPDKKEEVINFLISLPIFYMPKKYTLIEWGKVVGVKLTKEDYQKLGEK